MGSNVRIDLCELLHKLQRSQARDQTAVYEFGEIVGLDIVGLNSFGHVLSAFVFEPFGSVPVNPASEFVWCDQVIDHFQPVATNYLQSTRRAKTAATNAQFLDAANAQCRI